MFGLGGWGQAYDPQHYPWPFFNIFLDFSRTKSERRQMIWLVLIVFPGLWIGHGFVIVENKILLPGSSGDVTLYND